MLWFEREVVAALVGSDDPGVRSSVEAFVDGSLRDKPEHLRLGLTGESILLGGYAAALRALGRLDGDDALGGAAPVVGERTHRRRPPVRAGHEVAGDLRGERAGIVPGGLMETLDTEILVIGSGAGGGITAARLAEAGRHVAVVEEGPWVDADAHEPFSLEEMVAKYRHHGASLALGNPNIAYAEGRCVGGSTEVNSGLYHRLPDALAADWEARYAIDEFTPAELGRHADRVEQELGVSTLPGAPPPSSAMLERGATKLGWRHVEFARVFRYDAAGRGTKQTMSRTMLPARWGRGRRSSPTAGFSGSCATATGSSAFGPCVARAAAPSSGSRSVPITSSSAPAPSRRQPSCSAAASGATPGTA